MARRLWGPTGVTSWRLLKTPPLICDPDFRVQGPAHRPLAEAARGSPDLLGLTTSSEACPPFPGPFLTKETMGLSGSGLHRGPWSFTMHASGARMGPTLSKLYALSYEIRRTGKLEQSKVSRLCGTSWASWLANEPNNREAPGSARLCLRS